MSPVARRVAVLVVLVALLLAAGAARAAAHPLGNFTVNTYSGLRVGPDRLVVDYVVDMAEIPPSRPARPSTPTTTARSAAPRPPAGATRNALASPAACGPPSTVSRRR